MKSVSATVDGGGLVERVKAGRLPPPAVRASIRRGAGASLRDIGAELNVTAMTVHRWESGKVEPKLDHAIAYRRLLDQLQDIAS